MAMQASVSETSSEAEVGELLERLRSTDAQFRGAYPDPKVTVQLTNPALALAEAVEIVMTGYADRPAVGQRAREHVTDPDTGRTVARLLPHFDTISYGELWRRSGAIAADLSQDHDFTCSEHDFIGLLGFTSVDLTVMELVCARLACTSFSMQTGAPTTQQVKILEDTTPYVIAAGVDYLAETVDAVLAGPAPQRIIVIDCDHEVDDHRDSVDQAKTRLSDTGIRIDTLDAVIARGEKLPAPGVFVPADGADPLRTLTYTSGSTGTPKGVIGLDSSTKSMWRPGGELPKLVLAWLPMSHGYGRSTVTSTLASGGTVYFLARRDMSTLFDDLALIRPTHLNLLPRFCELLHDRYLGELDEGEPSEAAQRAAADTLRNEIVGGRVLSALTGSAPLAPELKAFIESALRIHVTVGYGASEMGNVTVDGVVQRPPVIDYKLIDVPELGYFSTDRPYPRGELIVKTEQLMIGYFKAPDATAGQIDDDGYYHSNDIMAEIEPDHLVYVDRRNNVLKLAQGEFVAITRLESLYSASPRVDQIYLYGTGERSYLLAVVVPSPELRDQLQAGADPATVKNTIATALREVAHAQRLNGYELPRDFLVEKTPFSQDNGLLSNIGKPLRHRLKERYGQQLEDLYRRLSESTSENIRELKATGADRPTEQTVLAAVQAVLGLDPGDISLDSRFGDLGGDSLSALNLSNLLADIYGFEVSVGVIINPAGDLRSLIGFIDKQRNGAAAGATFASVHGVGSTVVRAADLALEKFIDTETLSAAKGLVLAPATPATVLLTGATGFLGRGLLMEWLRRQADGGVTLVCVSRGEDGDDALRRIEEGLDTDPELVERFRALAENHLEVVAGDLAQPRLGLDDATWNRLAESVDLIVHPAAHVNHVLPYQQLFAPNVSGTAELLRLALTGKRKPFNLVSSMGVATLADHMITEDEDVRETVAMVELGDGYGNGYSASKWASEVLVRNASEQCDLPVTVFRSGMILADQRYAGQINVPDIFTRLLYSVIVTGLAPTTFYAPDGSKGRPHASYGGVPVDALAAAIAAVGVTARSGFRTYNTDPGYDDGISLDTIVDWIVERGHPVQRIDDYAEWVQRFETAMRGLPDRQRGHSLISVMDAYRQPSPTGGGGERLSEHFRAATKEVDVEIPHLSKQYIDKNLDDLTTTGLL